MPIPTPTENEQEGEFIVRCMSDETMRDEYPDWQQRLAVCYLLGIIPQRMEQERG